MEKSVSTKQKVCQSLLELLKTRNIHKITVREILAKSGISRSQFYRLFKDKYDLLNQAISLEVDRIFLENDSISITPDKLTALLQVTKDAYWSTSLCHNEYSELFYIYYNMILNLFYRYAKTAQKNEIPPKQLRSLRYAAAGTTMMISSWLSGGCRENPQEIASELICLLPSFLFYE